jgi:hypothetical protein
MPQFVPFADFIKQTKTARLAHYLAAGAAVTEEVEFERMRAHLLLLYGNMTVTHSYETSDGNTFDCVPIAEQPGLRLAERRTDKPAAPPDLGPTPAPVGTTPKHTLQAGLPQVAPGSKDGHGNARTCPPGTIPMRRITLEEMTRFRTLEDFFRKDPRVKSHPRLLAADTVPHRYAHAYQFVNNIGGASHLNLWSPSPTTDNFSLSQHWYTGGSGSGLQTVEGGWQVYPAKYRTANAVLFIYWTADGYNRTGNYNLDAAAFVQTNGNWHLGAGFDKYSTRDGEQREFGMQWKRDARNGNWWLFLATGTTWDPVGYYPQSLFGTGQMATFATEIDYGGEVTGTSSGQMGSGSMANEGFARAAYQRAIYYTDTADASVWATLTGSAANSTCYTIDVHNNSGGDWGTYFYFGGARCS